MDLEDARSRLRDRLLTKGLDESKAQTLSQLLRPCLRFETRPTPDTRIRTGESKFGGEPDLPPDFVWPMFQGDGLNFLAQLNLTDLAVYEATNDLPKEGLLSFFYRCDSDAFGGCPTDYAAWMVVWSPLDGLVRRPLAHGANASGYGDCPADGFIPCRLKPIPGHSAPGWESIQLDPLDLTEEEDDAFRDAWIREERGSRKHQMLGYPIMIQGPMEETCEEGLEGIRGAKTPLLESKDTLTEWRLLLQIDSDESVGMQWGDAGVVYFWIREPDLAAGDFRQTWMVTSCH